MGDNKASRADSAERRGVEGEGGCEATADPQNQRL